MLLIDSCLNLSGTSAQGKNSGLLNNKKHRPKKQPKGREERIRNSKVNTVRINKYQESTFDSVDILYKLLKGYKKQEPPRLHRPTEVRLGIYVNSFYSISEWTMDFSLNIYLRQSWQDPRLRFDQMGDKINSIRLEDDAWNKLWTPDTFFR